MGLLESGARLFGYAVQGTFSRLRLLDLVYVDETSREHRRRGAALSSRGRARPKNAKGFSTSTNELNIREACLRLGYKPSGTVYNLDPGDPELLRRQGICASDQPGLCAVNQLVLRFADRAPAVIAAAGERASYRFFEFFTANIRNPHTRRAYARAAVEFFDWLAALGVRELAAIESVHVAAYIEQLQKARSAPTAKLRLAALRHLFDWLVIGQIMPVNPAAAVRGPRHIVRRGKTPVLDPAEARQLIDAIDTSTVIGLRDRALIGLMVYSFARIGAAIGMRVEDVYPQNRRLWVRLHEKGGKQHAMPCHHNLETYLHEYIDGAGLANEPKALLFQTYSRATGQLTGNPLPQANAYAMIQRRAKSGGITTRVGNHTFRATGVTAYLKNGGTLEKAAQMANHASTRTTQLYDRRAEEVTLDEVERILV